MAIDDVKYPEVGAFLQSLPTGAENYHEVMLFALENDMKTTLPKCATIIAGTHSTLAAQRWIAESPDKPETIPFLGGARLERVDLPRRFKFIFM